MITVYDRKTDKTDFNHNGLGVIDKLLTAQIIHELNGEYALEMECPVESSKTEHLKKFNVLKADGQLFRIHRVERTKDIVKVWARHISYDLAFFFFEDVVLPTGASVAQVIHHIKEGTPFQMSSNIAYQFTLPVTFKEINHLEGLFQMIEGFGGELKRDNFTIEINDAIGNDNGVLVSYGKNIQGIVETLNTDQVITRLYPIGADDIRLPEKYIDSLLINHSDYPPYPIPQKVLFDVYDEWTLRSVAEDYLRIVEQPKATYEIDFVELERSANYKDFSSLQKVHLGDIVYVKHAEMGIDLKLKVIKYTKDLLSGHQSKITLGDAKDDFMEFQQSLVKSKNVVDYAFRKGKLNTATLKGLKIVNEEEEKVTFEITEDGDTFIYGGLTIGPDTNFEEGYDPFEKANKEELGELAYYDAVEKSKLGTTIIEGGYLKTGFVDASRIDTGTLNANQVNIEAIDEHEGTVIKIGKIKEEDEEEPAKYGISITGSNGELMLDEYGIDPRFVKSFKNMIWNSSFERYDPVTKIPQYWTGGESFSTSSFDNSHSMKLEVGETSEQTGPVGGFNPRPTPASWGGRTGRFSFAKKGGAVQVQIFRGYDHTPYDLTDEEGNTKPYYNTAESINWDDGRYTFSFEPDSPGNVWARFSNIGTSVAYIDAVQLEPDFNGKYPSFYTHGPHSVSAEEIPMSNTWLEYVNVPYASAISVEFNRKYTLPPTITASLLRNKNAANVGSDFGNYHVSPNIDLVTEVQNDYLYYTGAFISFNSSAPTSIPNGYIGVQIVGRT